MFNGLTEPGYVPLSPAESDRIKREFKEQQAARHKARLEQRKAERAKRKKPPVR
jgi:hypothetical protein